jgi:membrane protease YdiL (CAAX protease family)
MTALHLKDLHPRRFFLDAWREMDEEAARHREENGHGSSDTLLALYIFAVVAISLILQEYLGGTDSFYALLTFADDPTAPERAPIRHAVVSWIFGAHEGSSVRASLFANGYYELWNLGYWAVWRVIGFLGIPALAVVVHPRLEFSGCGLGVRGFSRHVWLYGVLFVPVLVAVIVVSFTEEFSTYYPFYSEAHRSLFDFCVWESLYVAQFLSLEFFFRGFMIQPLRRILGSPAIFAMMIPYVMIHFGKPMPECFAAILAGVVLGTLALRTRSIWAGFLIHMSVALSMDVAAILQTHGVPWR